MMDKPVIAQIARAVLKGFLELQRGLAEGTLSKEQLDIIDSLPTGDQDRRSPVDGNLIEITKMTGRSRITRFPTACCADATAVLGTIYIMAGVNGDEIIEVKTTPRENNPAINFHVWLSVAGLEVDITLGQFHPLSEQVGNAVAFNRHPFSVDDAYTVKKAKFIIPTTIVQFAEHIGYKYVFEPQQ